MSVPLVKPTVGGSNNTWGTTLNTALDALNGADYWARRTADGGNLTTTTLADDAVLQVALPVGEFRVLTVVFATGPAAGDIKLAWAFTGTLSSSFRGGIGPTTNTTSVVNATAATTVGVNRMAGAGDTTSTITTGTSYGTDGTNISLIVEYGFLVVTVAGTFKIQAAQAAASGTSLVKAGSHIHLTQVA